MRIAYVSPHDFQGGASRIGHYLFEGLRESGHQTAYFVGKKSLDDDDVHQLRKFDTKLQKLCGKVVRRANLELGRENFYYPAGARQILDWKPDLIHIHNPQGGYFDLRALEELSAKIPVLFTLHDPWMFAGHCSYFIECRKWLSGCGNCPDLKRRPSLKRDGTAFNWRRKEKLYQKCNFYVATPSKWLMREAERSMLKEAIVEGRVINNGVNEKVFRPKDSSQLRVKLGIPKNEMVLLYVVSSQMRTNPYKDFTTISGALDRLREIKAPDQRYTFIALGADGEDEDRDGVRVRYAGFQNDPEVIATYFNMADLYLHAARAENYPNVVMESLACGTPCVVTDTGGVPEQIIEDETGWVVPLDGAKEMAEVVMNLSRDPNLLTSASVKARRWIEENHGLSQMINDYFYFYKNIITRSQK